MIYCIFNASFEPFIHHAVFVASLFSRSRPCIVHMKWLNYLEQPHTRHTREEKTHSVLFHFYII